MNFTRMLPLLLLSVCFAVLPIRAEAVTFTVNSTDDGLDADLGDGVCATDGGVCTLRAAIQEANALDGPDVVKLKTGLYMLTIAGASENDCSNGDLDIKGAIDALYDFLATTPINELSPSVASGFLRALKPIDQVLQILFQVN